MVIRCCSLKATPNLLIFGSVAVEGFSLEFIPRKSTAESQVGRFSVATLANDVMSWTGINSKASQGDLRQSSFNAQI